MAQLVFQDAIDYDKVRIHKGGLFGIPNLTNNAMTPRGEIYFPDEYFYPDFSAKDMSAKAWFIHELVHVWQYQLGYTVWFAGIIIGIKGGYTLDGQEKPPAYRYDLDILDRDKMLHQFNMEQQGELIAQYFAAKWLSLQYLEEQLPALERTLSAFLRNPNDPNLLPITTSVSAKP